MSGLSFAYAQEPSLLTGTPLADFRAAAVAADIDLCDWIDAFTNQSPSPVTSSNTTTEMLAALMVNMATIEDKIVNGMTNQNAKDQAAAICADVEALTIAASSAAYGA